MLQVSFIRKNTDLVKERLALKNFKELQLVDSIVALDDERKKLQFKVDELQAELNITAKEIGKLMAAGDSASSEEKKSIVAALKSAQLEITKELSTIEGTIHDQLIQLPNLPHISVPAGNSPEQNVVVKEVGTIPNLISGAVPHWDLAKKYDLINFELGNKITGSGFPVYKNDGARLQRALIQYFLDFNVAAGYTEYLVPHLVNEASAYGTGQLPDKEAH